MCNRFLVKILSILVLIAFYDICGFCVLFELNELAFLAWCLFIGTSAMYVFIMTTKLLIMLMELPRNSIPIEYKPQRGHDL